jgi:hypothetical protein
MVAVASVSDRGRVHSESRPKDRLIKFAEPTRSTRIRADPGSGDGGVRKELAAPSDPWAGGRQLCGQRLSSG